MVDTTAVRVITTPRSAFTLLMRRDLPAHLDGSGGTNRGVGRQQIAADKDWDAIEIWLSQFSEREATYKAYQKEILRFYVWVLLTLQKPLSSLVHEDWLQYRDFLKDPQPASLWVGRAKRPRIGRDGRVSDAYRPFAGPLAEKSIAFAERAIWQMFSWLRDAGYLAGNPLLRLARRKGDSDAKRMPRRMLSDDEWLCVLKWLSSCPREDVFDKRNYARNRWLIALFYSTGIRSSEAITAKMGDIFTIRDPATGKSRSFLEVLGKGAKFRAIPLTDEVLSELRLYRTTFGLSPMPIHRETTPLIFSVQTKGGYRPITRQTLYTVFKGMFEAAAKTLEEADALSAEQLRAASTHWMRHMAASTMLRNGTPVIVVRDVLGHEDLATTSIYSHAQALDVHREVESHNHLELHQSDA